MLKSSSLVIPIVLWSSKAPSHSISCVYWLKNTETLITGSHEGQIILWSSFENSNFTPEHFLLAHSSSVTCLTKGLDSNFISCSQDGHLILWNSRDGSCITSRLLSHEIPRVLRAYKLSSSQLFLFASGYYEDIRVYSPSTLTLVFKCSSKSSSNWISSFVLLKPPNRTDDVLLGLSISGTVKVWTLCGKEDIYYENESKEIGRKNSLSLSLCLYNMRTVLIVTYTSWSIYDAGDFSCLYSSESSGELQFLGGEFTSGDSVIIWSDDGNGALIRLPTNCIVDSGNFHQKGTSFPLETLLIASPSSPRSRVFASSPIFKYSLLTQNDGTFTRILIRGDERGSLSFWKIPSSTFLPKVTLEPYFVTSLSSSWNSTDFQSIYDPSSTSSTYITASLFLSLSCRLVLGRDNGSIILISGLELLTTLFFTNSLPLERRVLFGHTHKINCLAYPSQEDSSYDSSYLLSGSSDLSVILWDIETGKLLHRFSSFAGSVLSFHLPPSSSSSKLSSVVAALSSDHSVSLLSLKDKKVLLLASRHLFPIISIKWRLHDDYLLLGTTDGSTYVWQMETGHLDRIIHGSISEEILGASLQNEFSGERGEGVNSALSFFRGVRYGNLSAIKNATSNGITNLKKTKDGTEIQEQEQEKHENDENFFFDDDDDDDDSYYDEYSIYDENDSVHDDDKSTSCLSEGKHKKKTASFPCLIIPFKSTLKDFESFIYFFDVKALIVQLLNGETQQSLERVSKTRDIERIGHLVKSSSPDTVRKISGFLSKVKERADDRLTALSYSPESSKKLSSVLIKIKERAVEEFDSLNKGLFERVSTEEKFESQNFSSSPPFSLLKQNALELTQILLSSLIKRSQKSFPDEYEDSLSQLGLLIQKVPPSFGLLSSNGTCLSLFTPNANSKNTLSKTLSLIHLLSADSLISTLQSLSIVSLIPKKEKNENVVDVVDGGDDDGKENSSSSSFHNGNNNNKYILEEKRFSSWSTLLKKLRTQSCLSRQRIELSHFSLLTTRWSDSNPSIRRSSQDLLLFELNSLERSGRIEILQLLGVKLRGFFGSFEVCKNEEERKETHHEPLLSEEERTAVVLSAVIGSFFDVKDSEETLGPELSRLTAKALSSLILQPKASHFKSLKAAIDLIGKGFLLWEPHLEVSKILLRLLEYTKFESHFHSEKIGVYPHKSLQVSITATKSLQDISFSKPSLFVTAMSREISRYNNSLNNPSSTSSTSSSFSSTPGSQSVVVLKAKIEILYILESLLISYSKDLTEYLTDVLDITFHCIHPCQIKNRSLFEILPCLSLYSQISHCTSSRRCALGTLGGHLLIYELRSGFRVQSISGAHSGSIDALAFSSEGKYLASYSAADHKLIFWTNSSGLFGLGTSVTKVFKSYSIPPNSSKKSQKVKLVWISGKTVTLLSEDGSECRFNA